MFVWACGRKGMALDGFGWACVWKGRALAGEGDHLPTRSGLNQGPLLVVHLGLVGTRIWAGICDHRWVGRELRLSRPAFASSNRQGANSTGGWGVSCGSAGQHSQVAAGRAQQSSVRALPHACRRSSGAVRVLYVRIDWHVKRPTNNQVELRAIQSQAGEGLAGRQQQIKCTQLQLSGSARTAGSVVVLPTPAGPKEYARCGDTERSKGAHQ